MPLTTTTTAQRSNRRRWLALATVCLAIFMTALDSSIVNVALPAIQHELHFTQSNLTWVIDAYLITFASFLLMAGRLGDLVGRKHVFLAGIALFTVSSLVCGFAQSPAVLIAGRFAQGIGGALSASVIIAMIVTEFPEARDRATAMSAYTFVSIGGTAVGLLVGGVLTQAINWHWIFFINLPIGIVSLLLGRALIADNIGLGVRNGVDITGSILVTVALMLGIYAIIKATEYGWLSTNTFAFGGAAIVLLLVFFVLESRLKNPIMPLRILRVRTLMRSSIVRGTLATGMFATFFIGALFFENVLGYSPIHTGLAFMPQALVVGAMSCGLTARLVTRFGYKPVLMPGMVCIAVGLLLLSVAGQHTNFFEVLVPGLILLGFGAGTSFMPLLGIAMSEVPHEDAGLSSGIANVSMQMSAAVGLAILGTVAANRTNALTSIGHSHVSALAAGYHLAFVIAAGCVAVGFVIAAVFIPGSPATPIDPEAQRMLAAENATEPLTT